MAFDPDAVASIIKEIDAAFAGLSPPGDEGLLHPRCMDDGDIVDFYGAPERRQLSDEVIVKNYAALAFFSAEAFRYYVPTFMIWSLNHPDSFEFAPESTVYAFDPTSEDASLYEFKVSKFSLFNEPQRRAIIRFLEVFVSDPELGSAARQALDNYWLPQAQGSS